MAACLLCYVTDRKAFPGSDAVAACKQYQQPEGSLSTNYFSRPGTSADIAFISLILASRASFFSMGRHRILLTPDSGSRAASEFRRA